MRIAAGILNALSDPESSPISSSLAEGNAGLALLFHQASLVFPDESYLDRRDALVRGLAEALESESLPLGLFEGLAGVGWVLDTIVGGAGEALDVVDQALLDGLSETPSDLFDLISGWTGIGLYSLQRMQDRFGQRLLEAVLALAEASAVRFDDGSLSWFTSPASVPPLQAELAPLGYFNLGLAHGVPGVLTFLATLSRADLGSLSRRGRLLLEGALKWFLRSTSGPTVQPTPVFIPLGREPVPATRPTWCYGDLGVAMALGLVAQATDDEALEARSILTARRAAVEPAVFSSEIDEPGLCHGAFGQAHLLNRVAQRTRDPADAEAARLWLRYGLAMRKEDVPRGGFLMRSATPTGVELVPGGGFLGGSAGAALVLMAAATDAFPAWDSVLGISFLSRSHQAAEKSR